MFEVINEKICVPTNSISLVNQSILMNIIKNIKINYQEKEDLRQIRYQDLDYNK